MRVLIAGASGQLARAIRETWQGHELLCPEESHFNLNDRESVRAAILGARPEVLLNAAAFTQVDRCETESDLAMRINGEAVAWMAEAANEAGTLLVQISTDYVFDGTAHRPYRESDPTNPQSLYGRSKLLGEQNATLAREHLIVRTAWLYDSWGKNFYLTMLNAAAQGRKLRVVDDQRGTPTTCRALARQLRVATQEGWRGLVHGTCGGETTWYGFAAEIFRQSGIQADLAPCTTAEYPTPARRPTYSVLDGTRRQQLGTDCMPDWREAMGEVIQDRIIQSQRRNHV